MIVLLIQTGAHVTIFARRQGPLEEAKQEIMAISSNAKQEINAVSLDLANSSEVLLPRPGLISRLSRQELIGLSG